MIEHGFVAQGTRRHFMIMMGDGLARNANSASQVQRERSRPIRFDLILRCFAIGDRHLPYVGETG